MARLDASDLAQRLGRQAEAVCRHYLSAMATVRATTGRWATPVTRRAARCIVRLKDSPKGPAGKWTDAATGEHGDLLDVIRESCGLIDFKDVADEARLFLSMPPPAPEPSAFQPLAPAPMDRPKPHGASSACRSRLRAQSSRRISGNAALRISVEPEICISTRTAIIARTSMRRPRLGRP